MAFSREEIEAFIAEPQQDPQLRDRVRNAILADDFLALPGIVARLGERVEQLAQEVKDLSVQVTGFRWEVVEAIRSIHAQWEGWEPRRTGL